MRTLAENETYLYKESPVGAGASSFLSSCQLASVSQKVVLVETDATCDPD